MNGVEHGVFGPRLEGVEYGDGAFHDQTWVDVFLLTEPFDSREGDIPCHTGDGVEFFGVVGGPFVTPELFPGGIPGGGDLRRTAIINNHPPGRTLNRPEGFLEAGDAAEAGDGVFYGELGGEAGLVEVV